ncbi:MAG: hypothetical protein EZS28_008303 [Streblomastix strix]|uniref:Uncharacterized protein n=1 Tax=Streblomastix strix TaxID=222440 RepID=A0A5J4WP11_9EUKA|nr:MAG: hypothetical protein EZS28_008303 [Streblomastix strix]
MQDCNRPSHNILFRSFLNIMKREDVIDPKRKKEEAEETFLTRKDITLSQNLPSGGNELLFWDVINMLDKERREILAKLNFMNIGIDPKDTDIE